MKILHTRNCHTCPKQSFCFMGDLTQEQVEGDPLLKSQTVSVKKGTKLYTQGENREYNYIVSNGLIKNTRIHSSGKEQVFFISYPGDLIGVDSLFNDQYIGYSEAIVDSYVCRIKRSSILTLAKNDPGFVKNSLTKSAYYITDFSERICILNCSAITRVAWSLINHSKRLSDIGYDSVKLPAIPRVDIASYLFITVETLSRKLTKLRSLGLIDFDRNSITIHSLEGLQEIVDDSITN